ncbi:phosphate-starvation-inducible PsiE family protein [Methanosphaerula subterraneus]|uniref:phosphate-starvation-inducible PsiE family protein n=1 Tax=Methanosphaerula subterraneus TaxID=3350244 RepID=UPI003F845A4F
MAKIPTEAASVRFVVHVISDIQLAVYVVIAALFSIVAIVSLFDAIKEILALPSSTDLQVGIVGVLEALLLSITVLTLLTTVTVYFQTRHFEPRPLLIAGLTSMIRHVIVSNVAFTEPMQILGTVAVLAVLIAGIVLTRPEDATDHQIM